MGSINLKTNIFVVSCVFHPLQYQCTQVLKQGNDRALFFTLPCIPDSQPAVTAVYVYSLFIFICCFITVFICLSVQLSFFLFYFEKIHVDLAYLFRGQLFHIWYHFNITTRACTSLPVSITTRQ